MGINMLTYANWEPSGDMGLHGGLRFRSLIFPALPLAEEGVTTASCQLGGSHIVSDPDILRGNPRLKGTRISVGLVLGCLAAGKTVDGIVSEFPDLTRDQIAACLDYAREPAEFDAVVRWPCGFCPTTVCRSPPSKP